MVVGGLESMMEMEKRRGWRVWSSSERRGALSGLSGGGSSGYVLALVGGVGGSVSSVLLALAESVEEAVLEGESSELSVSLSHVRAAWRLGSSCPAWEEESVVALLAAAFGRPASAEELAAAEAVLSFVWVDASRRWVVLPAGVSCREAVERFVSAWLSGEVGVVSSSCLSPVERRVVRVVP